MVAELNGVFDNGTLCCSLAKISMVAEHLETLKRISISCSLAKISMVAEPQNI